MEIYQQCITDVIAKSGFEHEYLDSFSEGVRIYHFSNKIALTFESSCVPLSVAKYYLKQFELLDKLKELESNEDCLCDW